MRAATATREVNLGHVVAASWPHGGNFFPGAPACWPGPLQPKTHRTVKAQGGQEAGTQKCHLGNRCQQRRSVYIAHVGNGQGRPGPTSGAGSGACRPPGGWWSRPGCPTLNHKSYRMIRYNLNTPPHLNPAQPSRQEPNCFSNRSGPSSPGDSLPAAFQCKPFPSSPRLKSNSLYHLAIAPK